MVVIEQWFENGAPFLTKIHHLWRSKAVDLLPPVLQVLQAWDEGVLHGAIRRDMCKKR